jgi:hypothetical protein
MTYEAGETAMRRFWWGLGSAFLSAVIVVACSTTSAPGSGTVDNPVSGPDTVERPLIDLTGTYRGFRGGLYPNASNSIPSAHTTAGLARVKAIRPVDTNGNPIATGKYVLLSVGMSNTAQEFCGGDMTTGCASETFMGQAAADPQVNKSTLVIVNGAQGGRDATNWTSSSMPTFDEVDRRLATLGLTPKQVQIVWLKQADAGPTKSLPDANADAYVLESRLGQIVRAIKVRYPNTQQVFLTSRTYAGYATSTLNPEPFAYESGFAVKWVIQAQIDQMESGTIVDTRAGDLNYNSAAPWIAWGPYPWAAGMTARSDGLSWGRTDFGSDGTHPSTSGRAKVGALLLNFFKSSVMTKCWFVQGQTC